MCQLHLSRHHGRRRRRLLCCRVDGGRDLFILRVPKHFTLEAMTYVLWWDIFQPIIHVNVPCDDVTFMFWQSEHSTYWTKIYLFAFPRGMGQRTATAKSNGGGLGNSISSDHSKRGWDFRYTLQIVSSPVSELLPA